MKSLKIALAALVGLVAVSCYNDFDTPAPQKLYVDDDMAAMGLTRITIAEVKEKFGPISNTGTNDNFSTTKTLKFGTRTSEEAKFDGLMEWPEASKYYIKGKVISSDRQGNIYKSLYIYDDGEWDGDDQTGKAGIELKLYNGLYLDFLLDLGAKPIKSQWVYVRLDGLYLGNYRMMLSIGGAPSDGINTAGNHKFYANSNLDNPKVAALNVFRGEYTTLDDSDIKEVDGSNYTSLGEADLGRLVRFNKIKIRYAGVKNQDGVTPPNLKNGGNANPYPSWIVTDWGTPIFGAWYRWAQQQRAEYPSLRFGADELQRCGGVHFGPGRLRHPYERLQPVRHEAHPEGRHGGYGAGHLRHLCEEERFHGRFGGLGAVPDLGEPYRGPRLPARVAAFRGVDQGQYARLVADASREERRR